jgi:hypothetical protein
MIEVIHFTGFIKGVTYKTYLGEKLNERIYTTYNSSKIITIIPVI